MGVAQRVVGGPVSALAMVAVLSTAPARAQERGAAALGSLVRGLSVSGRVLVIGAHPDDEDTQLITWLAKGRHVETAYLSLTRGDGGQNLLGNELGEALGAIRTEELRAARRIDGGRQYFTRAYDFGFSKSAEETFAQWPHDSVLRDVITVARAFRPHVIVSVFSGTPRDGHGHHQAAGILAREAYELAGDTVRFPRGATAGLGGWTVLKYYRRARGDSGTIRINVGEYDPVLGRSYAELSGESRSQHKSQGFGVLEPRGIRWYVGTRVATRAPAPNDATTERSIFDGIDTTWARFRGDLRTPAAKAALDSLPGALAEARARFDAFAAEKVLPALVRVGRLLDEICNPGRPMDACYEKQNLDEADRVAFDGDLPQAIDVARVRLYDAFAIASGVAVEATADRDVWAAGENVRMTTALFNRGRVPIRVRSMAAFGGVHVERSPSFAIEPDSMSRGDMEAAMEVVSRPWWLITPRKGSMFVPSVTGFEEGSRTAAATVSVDFEIDGGHFRFRTPAVFRYADPLRGQVEKPIVGAPAVSVLLDHEVEYAPANAVFERAIRVHVRSASSASRAVDVTLRLPNGLQVDTATRRVALATAGSQRTVTFNVHGRLGIGRHVIEAVATSGGQPFTEGYTAIEYDHIRPQRLYRPARLGLEVVDLKLPPQLRIAYITGVGDNVAPTLEQLGVDVTVLQPELLSRLDLSRFSAIVVGTRAYEAHPALVANNASLLEYVRNGGTAVVQYGQYEMQQPGIMPYPITIARPADRVTVESSPVRVLDPAAPVLTVPNRITGADFDGWFQDRTLYMPRTFDAKYKAVLEVNDPGEPPNQGAILIVPYGKGTYVYTTLAFFRQLPNGVPGAARLFVNLLAAKAR